MVLESSESSVIYLGRIPHGFYESEMNSYFSQFGTIKNLILMRNRRGASKHYAFIQFESHQVAKVVQETMDGYLLYNHLLICKVINKNTESLFKSKFRRLPHNKIERQKVNREKSEEEILKGVKRLKESRDRKRRELRDKGIEYEFEGY